jgi:hypothetical protein
MAAVGAGWLIRVVQENNMVGLRRHEGQGQGSGDEWL